MVDEAGSKVLFAEPRNLDLWMVRIERGVGRLQRWYRKKPTDRTAIEEIGSPPDPDSVMLPLAVVRGATILPFVADLNFKKSDQLHVVINSERLDEAEAWLYQMGWEPWRDDATEVTEGTPSPLPA